LVLSGSLSISRQDLLNFCSMVNDYRYLLGIDHFGEHFE
jgi:hypothetical protein